MKKTLLGILSLTVFLSAQNRSLQGNTNFSFPSLGVSLRMLGLPPEARAQIETLLQGQLQTLTDQLGDVTRRQAEFQRLLEQPQVDYGQAELALNALIEARDRVAKTEALLLLRTRMALTPQQWYLATGRPPSNEASATATLRTLNTAQITFAAAYNKGFTDGLNRLGQPPGSRQPDENGADLVDPVLSGAAEGGNFSFTKKWLPVHLHTRSGRFRLHRYFHNCRGTAAIRRQRHAEFLHQPEQRHPRDERKPPGDGFRSSHLKRHLRPRSIH